MSFIDKVEGLKKKLPPFQGALLKQDQASIILLQTQRHTQIVEFLRIACPAFGLVLIIFYFYTLLHSRGAISHLPKLSLPQITTKDLAMLNPIYEGTTNEGGTYRVTAKKARQDFGNMNLIKLDDISGELTQINKSKIYLTSQSGTFDQKANILELEEKIDITSDDGMKAYLRSATIRTKEGIITSLEPVLATFPAGTIESKELLVLQKEHKISFLHDVICHLNPSTKEKVEHKKEVSKFSFGNSKTPLTITSSQLDIENDLKRAIFNGDVRAQQEEDILETPQMIVLYENNGEKTNTHNPTLTSNSQGAEISRIDVNGPFVITHGQREKITGNTASFMAIEQIGLLQGNVLISSVPDKHVRAERAELNQKEDTALFTGSVTVVNGETELKGRRLFVDRKNSRTRLTAPPLEGELSGRITAHFKRKNLGTGKKSLSPNQSDEPNIGIADFKTSPDTPIDIEANSLDVDDLRKTALFKENVNVKQGGVLMISPTVKAYYSGSANLADPEKTQTSPSEKKSNELTRMEATESILVTTEDGRKVKGDWATYEAKSNTTLIGGNVELNQKNSVIRGTRLIIDMTTNKTTIDTDTKKSPLHTATPSWEPTTQDGNQRKSNRPSAIFFPNEFKVNKD